MKKKWGNAMANCEIFFSTQYCIRPFIGLRGDIRKQECYEDLSGCMLLVPAF